MASLPTTSAKVRRKRLTLAEKRDILDDLSNGNTVKETAILFGCTERTIQKTRAQSETILAAFQQSASNTQFKALQAPRFPDIESGLYKFVQIARFAKLPLSGSVLRCRALHIRDVLLKKEHHDAKRLQLEAFSASARWLTAFTRRHALPSIRLHGEGGSVVVKDVSEGIARLREQLADFDEAFIFNMDETGLFYKLFSKKTYVLSSKNDKNLRGTKAMKAKARVSIYVCTNATGTLKVPMSIIGTAKNPRCFRKGRPAVKYFSQKIAWSDSTTFREWFYSVLLPFIRGNTSENVALVMDNCGPHGADLLDAQGQVSIFTLPPNCTSIFQPMDMGVIAALKLKYKSRLLERIALTIEDRDILREGSKKVKAVLKGLDEGHDPHMLDVCDLIFEAWEDITETTLARCWIKADILPRGANNKLIGIHGKVKKEKSVIEEEDISCLARLFARTQVDSSDFVTPSGDSRINVADIRRWVTIEEEHDVREAMVNESFGQIEEALLGVAGTENEALNEADPVEEAPQTPMLLPPLRDVAKLFEGVEDLAEKTGVLGASEGLWRAKRAFFEACREQGRKKSRQTLISEHFSK